MSLSPASILPFLKGWDWKDYSLPQGAPAILTQGAAPIETTLEEVGWLAEIWMVATDAYVLGQIEYQGASGKKSMVEFTPAMLKQAGQINPTDPTGSAIQYIQPNPNSSLGIYFVEVFNGLGFSSTLPYLKNTRVTLSLLGSSTQQSALGQLLARAFIVTDAESFLRSLRMVNAIKDLTIPGELLRNLT